MWLNCMGLSDRITEEFLNENHRLIGLNGYPLIYNDDDDENNIPCYKEVNNE